jgi:outer membrane protein insertion porin family
VSYETLTVGVNLRLGFALTEEIAFQPHYSIYRQEINLPDYLNDCLVDPAVPHVTPASACYANGEASLPVRMELANGAVLVSLVGYTTTYNTLDNSNAPTSGLFVRFTQDLAGVGGDVNFIRSTAEARTYYEVFPDVVGVLKLQGGHVAGWGSKDLRMLDHFQMGPNLVRGFQPAGIGPRDLTSGTTNDALGGTMYWGASVEMQTPLYFLPKEVGIKLAAFADAGSLWNLLERDRGNAASWRFQFGAIVYRRRFDLGFPAWTATLRFRLPDHQGELRPYADLPLQRRYEVLILAALGGTALAT